MASGWSGTSRSPTRFSGRRLIGEDGRHQIFGLHAQELRRNFLAAAKAGSASDTPATQRQRVVNIGASSIAWMSTSRTLFE